MKIGIAVLALACIASPAPAQTTVPPQPSATLQRDMAAWTKSLAQQQATESRMAAENRMPSSQGQVEIVSLAEMDAPASIKASVAEGIKSRSRGTLDVAAGTIPSTSDVVAGLSPARRSNAELKHRLSYAPSDISRTPIGAAELLSTEPNGTVSGDRSTGVSRTYRVPNVGLVILSEDDYVASKTKHTLIRETLNTQVNGTPARSYTARSKDGRGKAELRWITSNRAYLLTLISDDGARIEDGEKLLMQIAKGISS
ncbi:hypothetical protein [Stenotrophomonas rhizophila]|uniref:hypothetical protein n=1 Tax=Stenotrophomonas rhizophila TaxID=216778 RepID=UPI001E34DF00|nr:hypothetical protein [Stenotrophomonas rhizophila]MCC7633070.1 hypothetical protein [Stenotrophomonas rhizophila]MCC7661963.1 hypothetical protein [Stenotrophomonas rhizophila]